MTVTLPEPLATYFAASNSADIPAMTQCFTEDAVVHDESEEHVGHAAIEAWMRGSREKYSFQSEPLSFAEDGATTKVRALVNGTFPGSPVELSYAFGIADGRITSLAID